MTEGYCENCGSTNGYTHHCTGSCGVEGCKEPKYFSCHDCGHMTSFFHITARGKKVLEILLDPKQTSEVKTQ